MRLDRRDDNALLGVRPPRNLSPPDTQIYISFVFLLGAHSLDLFENWTVENLHYSIVTFTTLPPSTPTGVMICTVAGMETFAVTAVIVFSGYVLGTRVRV